jgi:hypothetical protein
MSVIIWDLKTFKIVKEIKELLNEINVVKFFKDCKQFIVWPY